MAVGAQHVARAGEGAHEHQQRGLRQVEIGHQSVDHAKRAPASGTGGSRRRGARADRSAAADSKRTTVVSNRHDAPAARRVAATARDGRRGTCTHFRVHSDVRAGRRHARLERAGADVYRDISEFRPCVRGTAASIVASKCRPAVGRRAPRLVRGHRPSGTGRGLRRPVRPRQVWRQCISPCCSKISCAAR
jgi:hypothetical protein